MNRRLSLNTRLNLIISAMIFVLGASSIAVTAYANAPQGFLFEFRYMTVNGTVFTTIIAFIILLASIAEAVTGRAKISDKLYYFRLSSAVTECIIGVVIAMSFFPSVPDKPDIMSYESFCMHVVIPLLSIISFLLNRTPRERMHPLLRLNCAWLITIYAAVVITLILTGAIPQDKIPYSFLNFYTQSIWYIVYFGCFIYSFAYILSFLLTEWNRKLSVYWTDNENSVESHY